MLATSLPSQSNFFLAYILINGITTWSVFILQAGDMVKCWLLKKPYTPDLKLTVSEIQSHWRLAVGLIVNLR